MSFMPTAQKPVVVSSVFDASVSRMVVTAVFPMRDGKVYVNNEQESVKRIITKAIRSEYHNGNSGEVERMKAEIARLQEISMKQGLQAESDTKAVAELTVKVNEQAEFILKQRSRINGLKTRAFAYAYGMGPGQMPVEQFDLKLEDPVPVLTLNVAELSAIDIYCQKFGHNVLLQRRNGNLVISSPTGRNPLEVEVYHG